MNPSELAGWPGTHSPRFPWPSRQVFYSSERRPRQGAFFYAARGAGRVRADVDGERTTLSGHSLDRSVPANVRTKLPLVLSLSEGLGPTAHCTLELDAGRLVDDCGLARTLLFRDGFDQSLQGGRGL